jgi:hypothetical protein
VGPGFLAAGKGSFPSFGNGFDPHRPLQILMSYVFHAVSNICFSFPNLARRSFFSFDAVKLAVFLSQSRCPSFVQFAA